MCTSISRSIAKTENGLYVSKGLVGAKRGWQLRPCAGMSAKVTRRKGARVVELDEPVAGGTVGFWQFPVCPFPILFSSDRNGVLVPGTRARVCVCV